MFRVIDAPVFLGMLIVGMITGVVVAGTRGRQGKRLVGNAAVGSLGSIVGGLIYDLSGFEDSFTMGWPPLPELMIFSIAGAGIAALILVIVRKSMQQQ